MKINFTWKIWLLIIVLALSILAIFSGSSNSLFQKGVLVTSVEFNSTAFDQGFKDGQIIVEVDGAKIENLDDFTNSLKGKFNSNESVKTIFKTKDSQIIFFSDNPPEITVSEIKKTAIKLGLDLSGGARALVKAQDLELSSDQADDLASVIKNRLNVYGIEDIKVAPISDLNGEFYIKIEVAGATPEDLRNLVSQQGKFEAKIGNEVVFVGGDKDITSVSRSGQDAFVETCQPSQGAYFCNFRFTIFLSQDAARRHANLTDNLVVNQSAGGVSSNSGNGYLSERLDLFVDDILVDSLLIGEGLKGRVTTQISISGSGTGQTEDQAYDNAISEMNKLQTVLITGSLPYKLELVKLDTLSPLFGKEFIKSILIAGFSALLVVFLIVLIRYRSFKYSTALVFTSVSEVIIILGIASLIGWNLDLPSIAGILATIGTGIDQQIIVLDEARSQFSSIKQRMKRAFTIILGAYFTAVVALIPLYWAAAGFFKGFAITTLIGITAGILITRPAFTDIIRKIEE
ncbi:MAG: PDZ domain-containing protein [Nanoarchaeota archaeon]|nr:PDZ domain-containing protein [Nanoarchaeota archaeon]